MNTVLNITTAILTNSFFTNKCINVERIISNSKHGEDHARLWIDDYRIKVYPEKIELLSPTYPLIIATIDEDTTIEQIIDFLIHFINR